MTAPLHKIIFTGEALPGRDLADVRHAAQLRLSLSPKELELIFSGRRIVLKRDLKERDALRYIRSLTKLGMRVVCSLQTEPHTPRPADSATPKLESSLKAQMLAMQAEEEALGTAQKRGLLGWLGLGARSAAAQ